MGDKRRIFPALRCVMGDWVYYVTFMKLTDVAEWIKPTDEVHKSKKLSEFIQRELDGEHADGIAEYLHKQPQRLFNAIVVGVYGGQPNWVQITVKDPKRVIKREDEQEMEKSVGLLRFAGTESLFAIDGQHRVAGIKRALENPGAPEDDEISVILVGHEKSKKGQARTRRLFTTLNKTAKKVSARDIIALDEDNGFAVITRMLVDDFALFSDGQRISFGPTSDIDRDDKHHVVSLIGLFEITRALYVDKRPDMPSKYLMNRSRPAEKPVRAIYEENCDYWKLLVKKIPAYAAVFNRGTSPAKYRNQLLFRTAGQRAFASATQVLVRRGASLKEAVERLKSVNMDLESKPWLDLLWDPATRTMIPKNRTLAETALLQAVGEAPRSWAAGKRYKAFQAAH